MADRLTLTWSSDPSGTMAPVQLKLSPPLCAHWKPCAVLGTVTEPNSAPAADIRVEVPKLVNGIATLIGQGKHAVPFPPYPSGHPWHVKAEPVVSCSPGVSTQGTPGKQAPAPACARARASKL